LYLGLLALFIAGTLLSPEFLTIDNQRDVLWQVSLVGVMAVGMTLVILTGGIDLSVGSLLSVGSVVCAMLLMERVWTHASRIAIFSAASVYGSLAAFIIRRWMLGRFPTVRPGLATVVTSAGIFGLVLLGGFLRVPHGFGIIGVLLLVPPVGLLLGAINGAIIARGNLQPFIVTLAMMVSAVGLAKYIAGLGGQIHPIYVGQSAAPAAFEDLASNIPVFGKPLIPVPGIFFAVSAVAAWVMLAKMRIGRYIYSIGGNEEAARFSGLQTDRVKILVYAISGMLSTVAAILYCAQYQQGKADAGATRELDAIAAVVIGGTSLMGGRGGIAGTVVGVFIFGYLGNILNLRGVSTEFQAILKGIIIVLAVLLQEGILMRWITGGVSRLFRIPEGNRP